MSRRPVTFHLSHRTPLFSSQTLHNRYVVSSVANGASVIADEATQELYAYIPKKPGVLSTFLANTATDPTPEVRVTEMIDGTPLDLWYDRRSQRWEISVHRAVGGDFTFVRDHEFKDIDPTDHTCTRTSQRLGEIVGQCTFYEMFMDAMNVGDADSLAVRLRNWSKQHGYRFVMQHPKNILATVVQEPLLYVVGVHRIKRAKTEHATVESISPWVYQSWRCFTEHSLVRFPSTVAYLTGEQATPPSFTKLILPYVSVHSSLKTVGMGVVFTNMKTGEQSHMVSRVYRQWRKIQCVPPKELFRYLCVRRTRKMNEFLGFYPWFTPAYDYYGELYSDLVYNMFESYIDRYVHRTKTPVSGKYLPHIQQIHHTMYLPMKAAVSGAKSRITIGLVQEYIDGLNPVAVFQCMKTT